MSEQEYIRLTRLRRRRGKFLEAISSYGSLWLGKDHLLSVSSTRFSEDYKRFYFRDIQAFTIVQTRRREVWNLILSILLVLGVLIAAQSFSRMAALIVSLVGVPLLLYNNLMGPTCMVYIRTAVQVEELPSLTRVRRAQKVIARIRPLIQSMQTELAPEDMSARLQQLSPGAAVTGPASSS